MSREDFDCLATDSRLLNLARTGAAPRGMDCADLHKLTLLSMLMTDRSEEEILALAAATIPTLAPGLTARFRLAGRGWWPEPPADDPGLAAALGAIDARVPALLGEGPPRRYAVPVRSLSLALGHLVLDARDPVPDETLFVVQVLAQQLAVAVDNARRHAREVEMVAELGRLNVRLADKVDQMQRLLQMHERLAMVSATGGGADGITAAVADLTGHATAVEDENGTIRSSAGGWHPRQACSARARDRMLDSLRREPRPIRDGDQLVALVMGHHAGTGAVLRIADPHGTAGEFETAVLEHAATILSMELARSESVAEAELRLRRDLVEELLIGMPEAAAQIRAAALDIDLAVPRRVAVVRLVRPPEPGEHADALLHVIRRALRRLGEDCLPVARDAQVLCLATAAVDWTAALKAIRAEPAGGACWIGVGSICRQVADFPISLRQARQALSLTARSGREGGVVCFDDLGVYRLLAIDGDPEELDRFVQQWLGDLLEHDRARSSDLVRTLAAYLHAGGSIAATAERVGIHRSTVKYRLQRIKELTDLDLADPATHFAIQLAVHALETRNALFSADP